MGSGGSRPGAGRRRKDPALKMTAAERGSLPATLAGGMIVPLHLSDLAQLLFADAALLDRLRGRRCIISLDLASKVDIAAIEFLFPPLGARATKADPYIRIGRYFLPSKAVEDVSAYQGWDAQALLDVNEGDITDYEEIEIAIEEAREIFDVEQVAYDPAQATMLVTRLMKMGAPVLEVRPSVLNFSEPMKELDAMTKAGLIAHGGWSIERRHVTPRGRRTRPAGRDRPARYDRRSRFGRADRAWRREGHVVRFLHPQADLGRNNRSAADDKTQTLYSFKVTRQDGTRRFFRGRVFGLPETIDGADTMVMATPTIEICTELVKAGAV